MTNIRITALTDIGNNIAYSSLVPVVDMAGTPTTKKANLQIVGNLILSGAGGTYFAPAARAILSQSVTNAAQPNITSVGTLTSLAVTGDANLGLVNNVKITGGNPGQLLATDGFGNLSWVNDPSGIYNNSNVANYLPTFTGTVGANRISSNAASGSNVEINANGALFTFGQGGALYWPAPGSNVWAIEPNIDNEFEIKSTSNIVISTDISNANSHFTFDSDGIFTAPSNVNLLGSRLNVGPDAAAVGNLLNPTLVIANTGAQYIQAAIINNDAAGSSDWSADGAGGGDEEAWTDMGFAGFSFNDANFTVTAPGDGYLFVQGYANGLGGNMVLATGDHSNTADIIFATGGFLANAEFARIDHSANVFHLTRTGSGIKFQDGSIQTTAATGNIITVNLDGNVSNVLRGDGTFAADANSSYGDSNVVSLLGSFGSNTITTTGNVSVGNISATNLGNISSINLDGSNSNILYGNGVFAAPNSVLPITNGTSNINIATANGAVTLTADGNTWTFDPTGQLSFPGNQGYMYSPGGSDLRIVNNQNSGFLQLGWQDGAVLTPGSNLASNVTLNSNGVVVTTTDDTFTTTNDWTFGTDGNLTIPGSSGGFIKTVSNASIGIAAVDNGTNNPAQLMSINAGTGNPTTIVSAYASNATIQSNVSGTINTWSFGADGNLTLPGNTIAINFANNSPAFGNMVEWTTAPVANTSAGTAGQAAYDSGGNLYVCVATNTWAKFAGTTSW